MAIIQESGHVVNSTNIANRVSVISRHQTEYQPANDSLLLSELTPLSEKVKKAVQKVIETHQAYTRVTANRRKDYDQLDTLASKAFQILKSSDASAEEVKMGKDLFDKYKSVRVKDIPDAEELKAKAAVNGETPPIVKNISVSQQGYTNRVNNFLSFVNFLKSVNAYQPNEAALKTAAMESVANNIIALNEQRNAAADAWSSAIKERNKIMYGSGSGAYEIMTRVMAYVAGSAGKDSAFYTELQKYPVRNLK